MTERFRALSASLFFFAILSTGCLSSPLLNHADASAPRASLAQFDPNCPLFYKTENLCASLTWTKPATEDERGEFTLRFWDRDAATPNGPYVDPSHSVFVKLWMPSMGHGSSPVKVVPTVDASGTHVPGVYDASEVYFVMPGAWEIWVQLRQGKQVLDEAKIDIQI